MIEDSASNCKPPIRDLAISDVGELTIAFLWASWTLFIFIGLPVAAWKYFEMEQVIPGPAFSMIKYLFYSFLIVLAVYDLPGMIRSLANGFNDLAQCASDFNRFWQLVILFVFFNLFYFWEDYPNVCLYTVILLIAPLAVTYEKYREIMASEQ